MSEKWSLAISASAEAAGYYLGRGLSLGVVASVRLEIILFRMADSGLTAKIELRLSFSWAED